MESFFGHDKLLIEGLQILMTFLKNEDSIDDLNNKIYLKWYNLENINNSNKLSLRIIPKKRKRKERVILFVADDIGSSICILEINDHNYKI